MFRQLTAFIHTVLFFLALSFAPAHAVNPDEVLQDPVLEERARLLSTKLRCLVCQNQSIDDSDAPLAKDLRLLLRKRLVQGDSNDQVISYIVGRYGEFVLLQPRLSMQTIILWGIPLLLLLAGAVMAFFSIRNSGSLSSEKLSKKEQSALTKLLDEGE